ncbi:MAG: radical SAM protein [Candidatus Mcinerneyibacterium aminivorans]|uniref:Radical SAM protein n=1 Tax=Candidatus Mcinerneyibacterium aminivorans TaxID=2703815 RepID=A0A5D0MJZ0_9BACT|nr:MAG: radical SAM protein [Candidatus Mcinerneyibacterium aminivorans]
MILLVNPWIHDYTAYDLWAKPLGLIEIYSWLKSKNIDVELIDFLYQYYDEIPDKKIKNLSKRKDGRSKYYRKKIKTPDSLKQVEIPRKFYRYGNSEKIIEKKLKNIKNPELILVTSMMTYWYPGIKDTIKFLKKLYPDTPIVLGGIYAKLMFNHAKNNINVDYIVNRKDYINIKKIIKEELNIKVDLPQSRLKLKLKFDAYDNLNYVPFRFSIGCPFNCSYCGSTFLEKKYRCSKLEFLKQEYLRFYNKGIRNFAFYDDALLLNSKKLFKPFFKWVIEEQLYSNFHLPNAVHINYFDREIAYLMKRVEFKNIRFGFETIFRDKFVESKTDRKNFQKAVNIIEKENIDKRKIRIYLIAGMPGQKFENVKKSIKYIQSHKLIPIPNEYSPVPHTEMFTYALKVSPYDLKNEPLYHNKTIVPCNWKKMTYEDIQQLKQLARYDVT